jgi:predicted KAP-like P-loop ATPase
VWSDRETAQDCLGYRAYVEVLAKICTHADLAPLTLGIFGPWGSGKTSLMQMVQAQIEATKGESNRKTIWFNAWMYEGREEAQTALIHAILNLVEEGLTLAGEAKQLWDKLKKGASVLKLSKVIMKSALTLTPDISGFVDAFQEESSEVAETMESFEKDLKRLFELVKVDRIIVFIDDLDRCSSAKVIETFETIKLFLNTPSCTFVIGADADRIKQAVGEV